MKKIIAFTLCAFTSGSIFAALPPLTPEAQEAKILADAKTAYAGRVGAFQLCQAINKVADQYRVPGTPAPLLALRHHLLLLRVLLQLPLSNQSDINS